jgi:quinol-cytochrome oxidoreductase complex cytochrome b subunit
MMRPPRQQRLLRKWGDIWALALFIIGIGYLCQWVFSPGATVTSIIYGVQVAAVIIGIIALFRWAVLRERHKGKPDPEA